MLSFKEFSKQIDENRLQKIMNIMGKNPGKTLLGIVGTTVGIASALEHGGDPVLRGTVGGAVGGALGSSVDRVADTFRNAGLEKPKILKTKTQKTDE